MTAPVQHGTTLAWPGKYEAVPVKPAVVNLVETFAPVHWPHPQPAARLADSALLFPNALCQGDNLPILATLLAAGCGG